MRTPNEQLDGLDSDLAAAGQMIESLHQQLDKAQTQSARRLEGLCKCGIERDQLRQQAALLREALHDFRHNKDEWAFIVRVTEIIEALAVIEQARTEADELVLKQNAQLEKFREQATLLRNIIEDASQIITFEGGLYYLLGLEARDDALEATKE